MGKIGVLGKYGESRCFSNGENWCFGNKKNGVSATRKMVLQQRENGVSSTGKIKKNIVVKQNRKVLLRGNVGK